MWLEPISPALDASQLGDALALNLTALSLLAMAVGLFLVFNAQRFVQSVRRPQLAQLMILGMAPSRVLGWLILELVILATIGTLLGVLLGSLLALALMGQLTQALADLYGPNPIDLLRLSPVSLLKALLIGLLGTLAANLPGWWQLLRQSPLETAGREQPPPRPPVAAARAGHRHPAAVCPLSVAATNRSGWRTVYRRRLAAGHGALAARCPARPAWLVATAPARPPHRPTRGGRDPLSSGSHRHRGDGVAAGHRGGHRHRGHGVELSHQRGDLARPASGCRSLCHRPQGGAGSKGTLNEATLETLPANPLVSAASRRSVHPTRWQGQPIEWAQMDFIPQLKAAYPLLAGRWPTRPDEVLASEPLTVRLGVKVGQTLEVSGEQGPRQFTVTGVYQDYGSDKGQILHAFEAGAVQSLALFSDQPEQLADRLRARFGEQLTLLSAPAIHAAALKVFDQTFVVTELLKLLILGIAFVGIGSAFMVLGLARRSELQTLQSLGLSPRHCRRLLVWQGAGLGLLTALLALPVGYGLAWVLIEVVNPRAFGWRLAFEAAPLHAVTALLLAPVCGALASWYAARRVV